MPSFVEQPRVVTREPFVTVEGDLEPGPHRFRLVVVDAAGNVSAPAQLIIQVIRRLPIEPVGPVGPVGPIDILRPGRPGDPDR